MRHERPVAGVRTVAGLDIALEVQIRDVREGGPEGLLLSVLIGNPGYGSPLIDLSGLEILATYADGRRDHLFLFDPSHAIRPLHVEPRVDGREVFAASSSRGDRYSPPGRPVRLDISLAGVVIPRAELVTPVTLYLHPDGIYVASELP